MPSLSPDRQFALRVVPAREEHAEVPSSPAELASWLAAAPAGSTIMVLLIAPPAVETAKAPARADEDSVKKWYSTKEIASIHGVRPATVQRWVRERRFAGVQRLPNGAIRIPKETADEILRAVDGSAIAEPTVHAPDASSRTSATRGRRNPGPASRGAAEQADPTFDGWRRGSRAVT